MRNSSWREDELEHVEDGPFVSFTDLLAGVLFIFLILIAYFLTIHRGEVETAAVAVQKEVEASTVLIEQRAKQLAAQNTALSQQKLDLANQLAALKSTDGRQSSDDSRKDAIIRDLTAQQNQEKSRSTALEAKVGSLQAEIDSLKIKSNGADRDATAAAALKSQLEKVKSDNNTLQAQLAAAHVPHQGNGLDFHKAMVANFFEQSGTGEMIPQNGNYFSTNIIYISNDYSDYFTYRVMDVGNYSGRRSALNSHLPTLLDVSSRHCTQLLFTHDRIQIDCTSGLTGRLAYDLLRISPTRYRGTVSGLSNGRSITDMADLEILEITDDRLR